LPPPPTRTTSDIYLFVVANKKPCISINLWHIFIVMEQKSKETPNKDSQFDNWKVRLTLISIIILLWAGTWYFLIHNNALSNFTERGQFGDMFGVINSLFSGLAFAGIIYTILLQREELKAQREELKLTKQEFIKQNETLRLQRFENTFFKLLDMHNGVVDTLVLIESSNEGRFESNGRTVFNTLIRILRYSENFKSNPTTAEEFNRLSTSYKKFLKDVRGLDYYFQSLVALLDFVAKSELLENSKRESYFRIITSTQLPTEHATIFYYIAYGWIETNDFLSHLRFIEKNHRIYHYANTVYLTNDNNHHYNLLERFFNLFPYDL
jgi:hypothetical protein